MHTHVHSCSVKPERTGKKLPSQTRRNWAAPQTTGPSPGMVLGARSHTNQPTNVHAAILHSAAQGSHAVKRTANEQTTWIRTSALLPQIISILNWVLWLCSSFSSRDSPFMTSFHSVLLQHVFLLTSQSSSLWWYQLFPTWVVGYFPFSRFARFHFERAVGSRM